MPALSNEIIADIEGRLVAFLSHTDGYGSPTFLSAGGSAAVFRVETPHGPRAIKGFDPGLFNAAMCSADKRRLEVQRRLVGHNCNSLVQTYRVEEDQGTAFMEMEFVPWPAMTKVLGTVPDAAVAPLIVQLVAAVKFLEVQDIVHRDIKPENIHISEDFSQLKLLDLGVAREFELAPEDGAGVTDNGNQRPFLATAQYSSPEYLFRLDQPSAKLWQGLNFYQVGAVLHDLIMKEALFHQEMEIGNRWLVARAVLAKTPSFADGFPERLSQLKALASRCLVKDLDTRLQLVGWDDFILEGAKEPLAALKGRLAKVKNSTGGSAKEAVNRRLLFDQAEFTTRLTERVRTELIEACGTQLPITVKTSDPGALPRTRFILTVCEVVRIECVVHIDWLDGVYCRAAKISLMVKILHINGDAYLPMEEPKLIYEAAILQGEEETVSILSSAIAAAAGSALDMIENAKSPELLLKLHGITVE
jgi:eukaryotic-like serine/threonine-protein kinase